MTILAILLAVMATVTHVVDGDTVDVVVCNEVPVRVRLAGIDCPEKGQEGFEAATARVVALCEGKSVELRPQGQIFRRDSFNRLLAFVVLPDGRDLGRVLLDEGLAKEWRGKHYPN